MRRMFSIVVTAALLVGAFSAPAAEAAKKKKKKKVRKTEATYASPAFGVGGVAGLCLNDNGCARIASGPGEKFVSIEVADTTGTEVYARITQDTDGDGQADTAVPICGATEKPIAIQPGIEVSVFVYVAGNPPCGGVPSSGTVKATFSNRP